MNRKQIRHGPLTVMAHWPRRLPFSGCSPTLLSGLIWSSRSAAFNTANSSSAASTSRPRHRDLPDSNSRRVAELPHERITSYVYYVLRTTSNGVQESPGSGHRSALVNICPVRSMAVPARGRNCSRICNSEIALFTNSRFRSSSLLIASPTALLYEPNAATRASAYFSLAAAISNMSRGCMVEPL